MPMSEAALAGIAKHGLYWRGELNLGGQPARLADVESLKVGDCAAIRDEIVRRCRTFVNVIGPQTEQGIVISDAVDDLEMCDDDPDELRLALGELYDEFDFYRVCVVG